MIPDAKYAGVARQLARSLRHYARERDMQSKKEIAEHQHELCVLLREEDEQPAQEEPPKNE
jgi:hypothetical protein